MINKVNFSQNSLETFADVLGALKESCCPSFQEIKPIIQLDSPKEQVCSNCGVYTIHELNQMVQKNQELPPHIDCIKMDGMSWFFSTDDCFDFYSNQNYVTLNFSPQRLINPKILKDRVILNCVKKMLALIAEGKVSATDLVKVFPEGVCKRVYELCPPREYILSNATDAIERVRRVVFQHLKAHHESDIRQLPEFQAFESAHQKSSDVVLDFLKKDYRGFLLAEEWGYITNSKRLVFYQKLRDVPRHPSKLMPDPIFSRKILGDISDEDRNLWIYHAGYPYQKPAELYDDFKKALSFVKPSRPKDMISYNDATCSIWVQQHIEKFKKILDSLPRSNKLETFFQKNFPEDVSIKTVTIEQEDKTQVREPVTVFSSFYIRKKSIAPITVGKEESDGSISLKEKDFRDWKKLSDTCAHANEGYQESSKILSEDMLVLSDFVEQLTNAYQRKYPSKIKLHQNLQQSIR